MKVGGYLRVSTSSDGQAESPENQRNLITDWIVREQHDLYDFYKDVKSGTTDHRTGLKQLIKDAENKKFEIIIVKELSRLGRNVELLYKLKRLAELNDIRIISLDGKIDTADPEKLRMFGIYAWMAESESQQSSERIKSVMKMKQKQGQCLGYACYGYHLEKGVLIPREDETVDVVHEIFAKCLEGWGPVKIANYLSDKGIPTPKQVTGASNAGTRWNGTSVRNILQNVNYIGNLVQGKCSGISVTTRQRKPTDESEWIRTEGTHEAIVSKEVFNQAQRMLASRAGRGRGKTKAQKSLFTNTLYCADCGHGMWSGKNNAGSYYVCGGYRSQGKNYCTTHMIKKDVLIATVLGALQEISDSLGNEEYLKDVDRKTKKIIKQQREKESKLQSKLNKQRELKQSALEKFISGDISKADYDSFIASKDDLIDKLEAEIQTLKSSKQISNEDLSTIKAELETALKFDKLTHETLCRFIEKIEVTEDRNIKLSYAFAPVVGF